MLPSWCLQLASNFNIFLKNLWTPELNDRHAHKNDYSAQSVGKLFHQHAASPSVSANT